MVIGTDVLVITRMVVTIYRFNCTTLSVIDRERCCNLAPVLFLPVIATCRLYLNWFMENQKLTGMASHISLSQACWALSAISSSLQLEDAS